MIVNFTMGKHANRHESKHARARCRRPDDSQCAPWACTPPLPGPPNSPSTQLACPPPAWVICPLLALCWPLLLPPSPSHPPPPPRSRHRPLSARHRRTRPRPTCARGTHAPVSACMECAGCRAPDGAHTSSYVATACSNEVYGHAKGRARTRAGGRTCGHRAV